VNMKFRFLASGLALLLQCAALLFPPTGATAQTVDRIEIVPNVPHSGPVAAATFLRDGSRIASGSRDRTIKLWDAATGRLL
jgi:WD40 repeat protein